MVLRLIILSLLASYSHFVNAAAPLTISLYSAESVSETQNLTVTARIQNTGKVALKILNDPNGLLSTLPTNKFRVSHEGGDVPFVGAVAKYNPETLFESKDKSLFTFLEPGQTFNVTHNLNEAYNFSAIDFDQNENRYIKISTLEFEYFIATSKTNDFKTFAIVPILPPPIWVDRHWFPIFYYLITPHENYVGCTKNQQTDIHDASVRASIYADSAVRYLGANTAGTPRYTTWFGTYDSGRHSTVLSHFASIHKNDLMGFTYDCTCTDAGVYAFVYPNIFGTIHLCPVFFSSPLTGTDSKAGTIIHEASHFTANGGTQDYRYGQSGAQTLATTDPANAVMNADSHEYFAENTPRLS
ncbi:peptidyl-Lys metalloendopeptidase [Flagelloscypha sp. PMI_526]|nr:peptidyl-Lys metalloendopeptidase [Flagelloscypha sp. PMI_526]